MINGNLNIHNWNFKLTILECMKLNLDNQMINYNY